MSAGLLIAGGGLAAQRCCETLRAAGDDRPVTILAAEPTRPYDRPPLSKQTLLAVDADVHFRAEEWYAEHGIDLRPGHPALGLDPVRREVATAGGERVPYDDLLIATGAAARTLPELAGFANAQTLRTVEDAHRLRRALEGGGPLAIVGAGLIGLEVAAAAVRSGVEVSVLEAAPRPLAGVLGPRAAAWLTALHRGAGATVHTGASIVAAHGREAVEELRLTDGTRVACAHVLVAIGVRPAIEWVAGSGLDPGGLRVDARGRTMLPRVFAAGDATGSGHWEAASRAGAVVAEELLGRPRRAPAPPSFWSDQYGVRLVCVGDPREANEVLTEGDFAAGAFELDHLRDGSLTAVLLAGRPPAALRAARTRLTGPHDERTAA